MGELQWALLIVCAVLVVALYVFSRRGKSADGQNGASDSAGDSSRQMDLLARDAGYDEFGVGRPRPRGGPGEAGPSRRAAPAAPAPGAGLWPKPPIGTPTLGPAPSPPGNG